MNRTVNTLRYIIPTLSICLAVGYFLFYYRFSFNYETDIYGQYLLVFALPVYLASIILFLRNGGSVHANIIVVNLIIAGITCISLIYSNYYSFSNEHFFVIIAIGFLAGSLCFSDVKITASILIHVFFFFFLFQMIVGVYQLINGASREQNEALGLQGTLQNSGIFACYLVVHLPLLTYLFQRSRNTVKKTKIASPNRHIGIVRIIRLILFLVIVSTTCCLIIKTESRTAYIALFLTILSLLLSKYGPDFKKRLTSLPKAIIPVFLLCFVGFTVFAGKYLFAMKKMSAWGRAMKLQITLDHISEDIWFGTGLGRFAWHYPQWQAKYFAMHPRPLKGYFLSAGESYIIFNEYLQLLKEVGVIGFVIFCFLLYYSMRARSIAHQNLLNALRLILFSILACGFTSYPLHVNILTLFTACCMVGIFMLNDRSFFPKFSLHRGWSDGLIICLLPLLILAIRKGFRQLNGIHKWENLTQGMGKEVATYGSLYPLLKNDGKFLTEYGISLCTDSLNYIKSSSILEEAKLLFITRKTIEATALAYEKQKETALAIRQWKWLGDFLPNTFSPQYAMLRIYKERRDSLLLEKTAIKILAMPVKINSQEVSRIKAEAKLILDARSN